MTKDGTIDEELTKDNIIQIEGWVWDTNGLPHPDTKEAKGRSGWKSGMVLVKISDLEMLGFVPRETATPEKSATPVCTCAQTLKDCEETRKAYKAVNEEWEKVSERRDSMLEIYNDHFVKSEQARLDCPAHGG